MGRSRRPAPAQRARRLRRPGLGKRRDGQAPTEVGRDARLTHVEEGRAGSGPARPRGMSNRGRRAPTRSRDRASARAVRSVPRQKDERGRRGGSRGRPGFRPRPRNGRPGRPRLVSRRRTPGRRSAFDVVLSGQDWPAAARWWAWGSSTSDALTYERRTLEEVAAVVCQRTCTGWAVISARGTSLYMPPWRRCHRNFTSRLRLLSALVRSAESPSGSVAPGTI